VDTEESQLFADTVTDLSRQRAETVELVLARRRELDDCMSRWTEFDNRYQKLTDNLSTLLASVDGTKTLVAEDAIANIENVSITE